MPTVQRYGGRRVSPEALPGVRKRAASTALAEGAGVEEAKQQTAGAISQFSHQVGRVGLEIVGGLVQQERDRADQTALLEAENHLAKWEQDRLYNPQTGVLNLKGKDAMPVPEMISAEFEEQASEIESTLATDRQRMGFARVKAQRAQSLDAITRRHTFGEMQRYEADELNGLLENSSEAAVSNATDPRRVAEEMGRGELALKQHGPRLGMGPEELQKRIGDFRSATHVGVIDNLLATPGNTAKARAYYEEVEGQVLGAGKTHVEAALKAGTVQAESMKQADAIINAGGTYTEQLDKAKAIQDEDVRDAVERRLDHHRVREKQAEADREEALLDRAYSHLDKGKPLDSLPAADLAALGKHLPALRSFEDRKLRREPIEDDLETYYALETQWATDPAAFAKQPLIAYKGKLSEQALKRFMSIQSNIKQGDNKAVQTELAGFSTKNQLVDSALELYGIDATPKEGTPEAKAVAQLRRQLDLRVDAAQASGRKVTNQEISETLDFLLTQKTGEAGSFWNLFKPHFLMKAGPVFSGSEKRMVDATIDDVPAEERSKIEAALVRDHRPVSDVTILDAWLRRQFFVRGQKQ